MGERGECGGSVEADDVTDSLRTQLRACVVDRGGALAV
jgi:hypothetical protein